MHANAPDMSRRFDNNSTLVSPSTSRPRMLRACTIRSVLNAPRALRTPHHHSRQHNHSPAQASDQIIPHHHQKTMARDLRSRAKATQLPEKSQPETTKRRAPPGPTEKATKKPRSRSNGQAHTQPSEYSQDEQLRQEKWKSWSQYASSSPFPDFKRPTPDECRKTHKALHSLHHAEVKQEFEDPNVPETIPNVLDAMIVAILSQATSWNNAKRAMNSMKEKYTSMFNYDAILSGGIDKLKETIRCGGLHDRKSKIIMSILEEVQSRNSSWDMNYLLDKTDEEAMKELLSFKYMGPKSASVVMTWCLKRNRFTVDTHIYRIAGLWGWRPGKATREQTQAHLDATIPSELKFELHFLLIAHGRSCPVCRGGSKQTTGCLLQAVT